jgi:hypothetical protein
MPGWTGPSGREGVVHASVFTHRDIRPGNELCITGAASTAEPQPYIASTAVNSIVAFSGVIGTTRDETVFVIDRAQPAAYEAHLGFQIFVNASAASGAPESWILATELNDPEFKAANDEIRRLTSMVRQSVLLPRATQEFEALLTSALRHRGVPDNVDEWSQHIAADMGDLAD